MTAHLAGWGVPRAWGGQGGDVADAARAIADTARVSPTAARRLLAQRAFIELLLHCPNVGLREYRLPMLLDGSLGGWVALELDVDTGHTVVATDTPRGWSLTGTLAAAPNAVPGLHLAALPVALGRWFPFAVVMLGCDADGLHRRPSGDPDAHEAAMRLEQVHYRDDETLADDGPSLIAAVRPAWAVLRGALA